MTHIVLVRYKNSSKILSSPQYRTAMFVLLCFEKREEDFVSSSCGLKLTRSSSITLADSYKSTDTLKYINILNTQNDTQ